ncbi:LamG-like jellyroll fold domain-containing protein [Planctomycetota bacterium]
MNGKYGSVNAICFYYRRAVDDTLVSKWYNNLNDGLWHHYVVVREKTAVRSWRDAVSEISDTHENNAGSFSKDQMILVGHPSSYFVPGAMDDFRLYSRALTQVQIQELYNL